MDFTNGAATATLDALALLARSGFECEAFCSSRMDAWEEVLVEEVLAKRGVRYAIRNAQIGHYRGRIIFTSHGPVPVTLFNSASTRGGWINRDEIAAFVSGCEIFLRRNRPDLVWTYGGDPVSMALHNLVKAIGIPILFALHNFAYRDAAFFAPIDYTIVPTEFARRFYWETIGLTCQVLPLVMDGERVRAGKAEISNPKFEIRNKEENQNGKIQNGPHPDPLPKGEGTSGNGPHPDPLPEGEGTSGSPHPGPLPKGEGTISPQYVTFVNPEPRKGVHVFARIAEVLSHRRPDIPLLLVEGAGKASFLPQLGIDLGGVKNLRVMPNTPDPRQFYAVTKLLLMPSLMENAGFVAMEAMTNGIPVLASNRGGLPETVGNSPHPNPLPKGEGTSGGFLFDIPARYTPETRELPTAEEVEPWIETIIRLWDDPAEYRRASQAALDRAQQWDPERLAPVYHEFFSGITGQNGRTAQRRVPATLSSSMVVQ